MDHLNKKIINDISHRLCGLEGSLMGLGALFEQIHSRDFCFEFKELFGIGQLLKTLSAEVARLDNILRCGYDSSTQKDIYSKNDESEDEDKENQDHNKVSENNPELMTKNLDSLLDTLRDTLKAIGKKLAHARTEND